MATRDEIGALLDELMVEAYAEGSARSMLRVTLDPVGQDRLREKVYQHGDEKLKIRAALLALIAAPIAPEPLRMRLGPFERLQPTMLDDDAAPVAPEITDEMVERAAEVIWRKELERDAPESTMTWQLLSVCGTFAYWYYLRVARAALAAALEAALGATDR